MKKDERLLCNLINEDSDYLVDYSRIKGRIVVNNEKRKKPKNPKKVIWGVTSFVLVLFLVILIPLFNLKPYHNKGINLKNSATFKVLNQVSYPAIDYEINPFSEEITTAILEFTLETAQELFKEEQNYIYSPLSLYFLLNMINEGTSTVESETELNTLLGITTKNQRNDLKTIYENDYYSGNDGTLKLANSLWFNFESVINDNYLDLLTNNYYAEAYQTTFDDVGKNNIKKWIEYYTFGMSEVNPLDLAINSQTLNVLLNTIYFAGVWKEPFAKKDTYSDDFFGVEIKKAAYMKHEVHSLYSENAALRFETVDDYFKNGVTVTYILPHEEENVFDVFNNITVNDWLVSNEQKIPVEATISVPKFKYNSKYDLNGPLQKLGINKIFSPHHLENIQTDNGMTSLYIEAINQNAGIEFSEEGVKAFAFSWGIDAGSVAPDDKIDFKLNRPFIYLIKDKYGIPLFIGITTNPS